MELNKGQETLLAEQIMGWKAASKDQFYKLAHEGSPIGCPLPESTFYYFHGDKLVYYAPGATYWRECDFAHDEGDAARLLMRLPSFRMEKRKEPDINGHYLDLHAEGALSGWGSFDCDFCEVVCLAALDRAAIKAQKSIAENAVMSKPLAGDGII